MRSLTDYSRTYDLFNYLLRTVQYSIMGQMNIKLSFPIKMYSIIYEFRDKVQYSLGGRINYQTILTYQNVQYQLCPFNRIHGDISDIKLSSAKEISSVSSTWVTYPLSSQKTIAQ